MTVLFLQAVNDSQALTYILENFLNVMNTNLRTGTQVNIPLKQMPLYIKWKSLPKRKNNLLILGHEGPVFIDKGCDDFITFIAGHWDKLFTNVRDTSSKPFVLMIMGNTMENMINVVTYLKKKVLPFWESLFALILWSLRMKTNWEF